jgi:hypothetical protein
MKLNEIVDYKGIGTIQMLKDEDGNKFYLYRHNYFGDYHSDDTIKGAKEMLDWEEKQSVDVKQAIQVLSRKGYKVYKEIA